MDAFHPRGFGIWLYGRTTCLTWDYYTVSIIVSGLTNHFNIYTFNISGKTGVIVLSSTGLSISVTCDRSGVFSVHQGQR